MFAAATTAHSEPPYLAIRAVWCGSARLHDRYRFEVRAPVASGQAPVATSAPFLVPLWAQVPLSHTRPGHVALGELLRHLQRFGWEPLPVVGGVGGPLPVLRRRAAPSPVSVAGGLPADNRAS